MDEAQKQAVLARVRTYLDQAGDDGAVDDDGDAPPTGTDLYSLFVELAALRREARAQTELVRDLVDQVRGGVDTLARSQATAEAEVHGTRAEAETRARAALRTLLVDLIEVRDRLAAAARPTAAPLPRPWYCRPPFGRRRADTDAAADGVRTGLEMTLTRLDAALAGHGVTAIPVGDRPFDPRVSRAIATEPRTDCPPGRVIAETRAGFLWHDELLRPAEVIVSKAHQQEGDQG